MQQQVHKDANKYISLNNQYQISGKKSDSFLPSFFNDQQSPVTNATEKFYNSENQVVYQLNLVNSKQNIKQTTAQAFDSDRYKPLTVKQFINSKFFKYQ